MRATGSGAALERAASEPADHRTGPAAAGVTLVVRALGLERAAVMLAHAPGRPYVALAHHGGRPAVDDAWSAVVPLDLGDDGASALLLVARPGVAALTAGERTLVRHLADGLGALLRRPRLEHELHATRVLLAQTDRLSALGTLAAGVAHEIRNPLVSVRTFVQLLPERLHDPEFLSSFRELALGEIDRICALLGDLLAFSRPSGGDREAVDLSAVASQTVRLLDAEARKHGVALRPQLADGMPPVAADEAQLKQVVMNVVLNAIQASPARGTVVVRTHVDGDAVLEVRDAGPGIPPERLARLFEPFFTTKDGGNGLGLFLAHRIVTDHGGRIAATSPPGEGAVFTVRLPLAREDARDLA